MTEAERLLPHYLSMLEAAGLSDIDAIIRRRAARTPARACPAEIGIYGYHKNDFVIQVGGARDGTRIGKVLYERVPSEHMEAVLKALVRAIRDHNPDGLPTGEFLYRTPLDELRRLTSCG